MPRLTKRVVDGLQPLPDKDFFVKDGELPGFAIRVRPSGRKTFVLGYRDAGGSSRRVIVGEYGSVTAEEARTAAARLRADVLAARRDPAAHDPARVRDLAKRAGQLRNSAPTVAELADAFLEEVSDKLKPSSVSEYRRLLGISEIQRGPRKGQKKLGELRVALGDEKVSDVTTGQIAKLHLSMKTRPYMANHALAYLSALFTYAERQGHRPQHSNPCRGIRKFREAKRERCLKAAEYLAIGDALSLAERRGLPVPPTRQRRRATALTEKHRTKRQRDGKTSAANPVGVAVLRFLMLSGWREGEALTLRWDAVDFERGTAALADTKSGRSFRTLGAPALELIAAMRSYRLRDNPFVFPGRRPGSHFTDTARIWDAVRHAAGVADVRIHDLRHAFASVAASGGLTLPLIGSLLGHQDSTTTARYAHLIEDSRKRSADLISSAIKAMLSGSMSPEEQASTNIMPFLRQQA